MGGAEKPRQRLCVVCCVFSLLSPSTTGDGWPCSHLPRWTPGAPGAAFPPVDETPVSPLGTLPLSLPPPLAFPRLPPVQTFTYTANGIKNAWTSQTVVALLLCKTGTQVCVSCLGVLFVSGCDDRRGAPAPLALKREGVLYLRWLLFVLGCSLFSEPSAFTIRDSVIAE